MLFKFLQLRRFLPQNVLGLSECQGGLLDGLDGVLSGTHFILHNLVATNALIVVFGNLKEAKNFLEVREISN